MLRQRLETLESRSVRSYSILLPAGIQERKYLVIIVSQVSRTCQRLGYAWLQKGLVPTFQAFMLRSLFSSVVAETCDWKDTNGY